MRAAKSAKTVAIIAAVVGTAAAAWGCGGSKTGGGGGGTTAAETEAAAPSGPKIRYVAVVETEIDAQSGASAELNPAEVRQITAVLRKEAVKNLLPREKYNIMTSETVIAQGGAVLEECADENCVITLGSKIGADFIVRGSVSMYGKFFTVSVDIYETEDGNLVASSELVRSETTAELLDKVAAACGEMYRKFVGLYGGPVAPRQEQTAPQPVNHETAPTYQQSGTDGSGTIIDNRDGQKYRTVVINGKRWMAENLNVIRGNSWCYANNNSNCDKYGRLYDWNTARTACMSGWHLPSRSEWNDLVKAAGGRKAGKNLKARNGWNNKGNETDSDGFSALPGGSRYSDGYFNNVGGYGYWWTAKEYGRSGSAYFRVMVYNGDYVNEGLYGKSGGVSVRCVAD